MTQNSRRLSPAFAVAAALGLVLAASASAENFLPATPNVDKPMYAASRAGLEHYLQDELQNLIAGQKWQHEGNDFEAVRLHRMGKVWTTRARQANRDYSAGVRGWAVAHLHVKVNGQVMAARVEVNTSYVWQPGGWAFESVLLYLNNGDSYDFAAKGIR